METCHFNVKNGETTHGKETCKMGYRPRANWLIP